MNWGNDILQWLASDDGWRVLSGAIIPAAAILMAGVVGGLIGRGSMRRMIALQRQESLTAAVSAFVLAGRKASNWGQLEPVERTQVEHLIAECETRIRLLPLAGTALAANWAAHELESMKRDSVGFRFHAHQTLLEYRDRLIAWSERPSSAKKLFGPDLTRWASEAQPGADGSHDDLEGTGPENGEPAWVSTPGSEGAEPLIVEPAWSVAATTSTMPLVITNPRPADTVRQRTRPTSA